MLRKISAAQNPVLTVIETVCIEPGAITPPIDAPPEIAEQPNPPGTFPSPPLITNPSGGNGFAGSFSPAPICPRPELKTAFDPLTGTTRQYYDFGPGVTEIPAACQIGAGVFF